jgi:hypothetical protein
LEVICSQLIQQRGDNRIESMAENAEILEAWMKDDDLLIGAAATRRHGVPTQR